MAPRDPVTTVSHPTSTPAGDMPAFPPGKAQAKVAIVEHPAPQSRNRVFIALMRGDAVNAYELKGYTKQSVVGAALDHAGVEKQKSTLYIHHVADAGNFMVVMSFNVPADIDLVFVAVCLKIMLADNSSIYGVVHETAVFHTTWHVFERLRERCGDPQPAVTVFRTENFYGERPGDLIGASQGSRPIEHEAAPGPKTTQVSGPKVKTGNKPAPEVITRVMLPDVPIINQYNDFTWLDGYLKDHPKESVPKGASGAALCGVATLRMYFWYFNGVDLTQEETVKVINAVYLSEQGMAGSKAPAEIDARLGRAWHVKADFSTGGRVDEIPPCIHRRYPVPVGVLCFKGTIDAMLETSTHYTEQQVEEGRDHPHPKIYGYKGPGVEPTGHWCLAVGYEKKGKTLSAIIVHDPDTGCRVKVPSTGFDATFSTSGKVFRILTEPPKPDPKAKPHHK
jgi:hypothetical protein